MANIAACQSANNLSQQTISLDYAVFTAARQETRRSSHFFI